MLHAVVMAGGSGTRFWPKSRRDRPKQLLRLHGDATMLQQTVARINPLVPLERVLIITGADQAEAVRAQLPDLPASNVVSEPCPRDTAPCVGLAAKIVAHKDPAGTMIVMPADHVIQPAATFLKTVRAAVSVIDADPSVFLTFGVKPTRPETGYGYIERGADKGRWSVVDNFVEKPDLATAKRYVESGRYLWNSGMFVCTPRTFLEELERHANRIFSACVRALDEAGSDEDFTRLGSAFLDCPSDSIDYAVMEKTKKAAVVPLDAGWSDVGSWSALYDVLEKDADGNVARGDVVLERCKDSYVLSTGRLVAAIGLEGFVVIETADVVAVLPQREAQSIKTVVDRLKRAGRAEVREIVPSAAQRRVDR